MNRCKTVIVLALGMALLIGPAAYAVDHPDQPDVPTHHEASIDPVTRFVVTYVVSKVVDKAIEYVREHPENFQFERRDFPSSSDYHHPAP